MFCKNCEFESQEKTFNDSIWEFEPRNYDDFNELYHDIYTLTKTTNLMERNDDGFTYYHWYIYYFGKIGKNYKKYYQKIWWFFWILKELVGQETFKTLINEGMEDDSGYTCLHHLYKYCDNPSKTILGMVETFLIESGCDVNQIDKNGFLYTDYKVQKMIPKEEQDKINGYIKSYKILEKKFLENIFFRHYRDHFDFCEKCSTEINFIQKLEELSTKNIFLMNYQKRKLKDIIILRQKVSNIYKKYNFDVDIIENHDYVIGVYSNFLKIH